MKRLILFRHAKSSWTDSGLADHDRPLAPRGRRAAPAMARWLHDHDFLPRRVVCSSALRTRQTWSLLAEVWETLGADGLPDVVVDRDLYLAHPGDIRAVVTESPMDLDALMLVGHNPGLHDLAATLATPGATRSHRRLARKFPTAAVAVLDFDVERWSDLRPGEGRLVAFMRPKDLPDAEDLEL